MTIVATDGSVSELLKDIKTKEDLDKIVFNYGLNYQDSSGQSFLHELARLGNIDLIDHLFKLKIDDKIDVDCKDNQQRTALFYALNEDISLILLYYKIDYKSKDITGKTAMDVNPFVNYVVNQRCNNSKKKILQAFGIR